MVGRGAGTTTCGLMVLLVGGLSGLAAAYDEKAYADALAKYAKWEETYGSVRSQRQTSNRRQGIFLPHRPQEEGGKQFGVTNNNNNNFFSNVLTQSVLDTSLLNEVETESSNLVRGVRNPNNNNVIQSNAGLTGFRSSSGVPLYKIRKRYPLGYGRRRRSADPQGWVILDPATGHPIKNDFSELSGQEQVRQQRNPSQQQLANVAQNQYQDNSDQPRYKYYKKYPYSG